MTEKSFLEEKLNKYFGYDSFRLGQKEIISDVIKGNNVLGVLPTGSGKSLCYHLPAKILPGTTIVVSPLISLMIDQVRELKAINFKEVVALNSFMTYQERQRVYQKLSAYKLIYVSPEIIQQPDLQQQLKKVNINLFVIDEAHCISQWGHEFRPDYLKLDTIIALLGNPPILALSATAPKNVRQDIIASLNQPEMVKHIYPMDRPNITFAVEHVDDDQEKIEKITELLLYYQVPTLIYFSSRNKTEDVSRRLSQSLPQKHVAYYHGGMEQMDRTIIQQQFMMNQLDVICCTSAFGMGINKENIRLVIHFHMPLQLESYIQEVGRAGRDGSSSVGLLLYTKNDVFLPKRMIANELPEENAIRFVFDQLKMMLEYALPLPKSVEDIESTLQLNEVQWRFLYSQLEKHGIIRSDQIEPANNSWEQIFNEILDYRHKRFQLKEMNLQKMVQWAETNECLRQQLYQTFQKSYQEPTYHCCTNCDFSFNRWKPVEVTRETNKEYQWQKKLKKMFLIGVSNENTK